MQFFLSIRALRENSTKNNEDGISYRLNNLIIIYLIMHDCTKIVAEMRKKKKIISNRY